MLISNFFPNTKLRSEGRYSQRKQIVASKSDIFQLKYFYKVLLLGMNIQVNFWQDIMNPLSLLQNEKLLL